MRPPGFRVAPPVFPGSFRPDATASPRLGLISYGPALPGIRLRVVSPLPPSAIMKNPPACLFAAAVCAAALAFTGCSKSDRTEASAKVKEVYKDTKAAVVDAWGDVKSFTFEKKDDFSKSAKALSAKMDSQLSELRADYSEAKASASRKAAMAELKNSEADFKEKMGALGTATADTWKTMGWPKYDGLGELPDKAVNVAAGAIRSENGLAVLLLLK